MIFMVGKKGGLHYLKISFGTQKDRSPEIYDFFFTHLPAALHDLGAGAVDLEIERLEPLDSIYTNLDKSPAEMKKIFDKFTKCHHLEKEPSLTLDNKRTSLHAQISTRNLSCVLQDYNVLFDMFFADVIVKSESLSLTIDMMDGFSNSVLVFGPEDIVGKFKTLIGKKMKNLKFKNADSRANSRK
ncbi:MAG: hypothetical protein ABH854_02830 [Candidatus Diapherotrites archaeon]|nr:hypothetical protein [Candidatus Micrarchaeota archaeon]